MHRFLFLVAGVVFILLAFAHFEPITNDLFAFVQRSDEYWWAIVEISYFIKTETIQIRFKEEKSTSRWDNIDNMDKRAF